MMKIQLHVALVGLALAMSFGISSLSFADDGAPPRRDHEATSGPGGTRGTAEPKAPIPEYKKLVAAWEKANVGVDIKFKASKALDPADFKKDVDKEFSFQIKDEAEKTKVVAWMKGFEDYRKLLSTCLASKSDPSLRAMEELLDQWVTELYTASTDDLKSAKGEVKERRLLTYALVFKEFARQRDSQLRVLEKARTEDTKAVGFMTKTIDLITGGKFEEKTALGKFTLAEAKKDTSVKDITEKWKTAEKEISRRERDGLGSCNFDGATSGTPTPTPTATPSKTATPSTTPSATPVPSKAVSPAPPVATGTPVTGTPTPTVAPTGTEVPPSPTSPPYTPPPGGGTPPTGFDPNQFGNQVNGLNDPFANILANEADRQKRLADDALRAIQDALNGLRAQQAADQRENDRNNDTPLIIPPQQAQQNPPPPAPAPVIPPSDSGGKGSQPQPLQAPLAQDDKGQPQQQPMPMPQQSGQNQGSPIFVPAPENRLFEDDSRKASTVAPTTQPWGDVLGLARWLPGLNFGRPLTGPVQPQPGTGVTNASRLAARPPGRIRGNPRTAGPRLSGPATSSPIGRVPNARTSTVPSATVTRGRLSR